MTARDRPLLVERRRAAADERVVAVHLTSAGRDAVLSPDLQRRTAVHAGRVVAVDAGHIPLLSRPAVVAAAVV